MSPRHLDEQPDVPGVARHGGHENRHRRRHDGLADELVGQLEAPGLALEVHALLEKVDHPFLPDEGALELGHRLLGAAPLEEARQLEELEVPLGLELVAEEGRRAAEERYHGRPVALVLQELEATAQDLDAREVLLRGQVVLVADYLDGEGRQGAEDRDCLRSIAMILLLRKNMWYIGELNYSFVNESVWDIIYFLL